MRRDLIALLLAGCSAPASACPSGTHAEPDRAHAIEMRLRTVDRGRALLEGHEPAICFGAADSASVITTERVVILAGNLEEGEAAARLGHLLVHMRDGLPIDEVHAGMDPASCDAAVDRALTLEARAYVEEIALQDALAAHPTMLAFELADAVRAAPADARAPLMHTYLRDHPNGAPGIDGLASAYRAACTPR